MRKTTFGIIIGNRGFFPDSLVGQGRKDILNVLKENGYGAVALSLKQTKYGAVETYAEAKACAELFAKNSEKIDGIIVTLPNFGDEKGVAEAIKRSGLSVPVLIHAEADLQGKMGGSHRRDSFCGKISVCNNLSQAMIPFSLTTSHTVKVTSSEFKKDLEDFASVCRIVKGLANARFGAIGARTGAFNTVRYSEKILELAGIAVETIDLSEILGQVEKLDGGDQGVKKKLNSIKRYLATDSVPAEALLRMAKFGYVMDRWIADMEIDATAVQCWTSLQQYFGMIPCTLMSMMSQNLLPSACEVDITGALGMYILQLASGKPSAILDWNNNYGSDKNKCVLFHCSNIPSSFFNKPDMDYNQIIGSSVGFENCYGTVVGRISPGKTTFLRTSTDDASGIIRAYAGEGEFTNDTLDTFGGYGVMRIPDMQLLMQYVCKMGFEHHVAVSMSRTAGPIYEALDNYLGWEIYLHD